MTRKRHKGYTTEKERGATIFFYFVDVVLDFGNKPAVVKGIVRGEEGKEIEEMDELREKGFLAREANALEKEEEDAGTAKGRETGLILAGAVNLVRALRPDLVGNA